MDQSDPIITTREAAELLGVSVRTAQTWVEAGTLDSWKTPGGHRRVRRSSVLKLLAQRKGNVADLSRKVVLIEDDPTLVAVYEQALQTLTGVKVFAQPDCFTGLMKIGEVHPDLIVTDLRMVGMDGFEMIRHIRADARLAHTALAVLTGMTQDEIVAAGGLPDNLDVLYKPLSGKDIRDYVATRLNHPSAYA
ncbi:response regulator [Alcaligenaceae bacterium B3P038]|nr:response regulator [Alcaligenaceae bacterium B3P038]